MRLSWSPRTRAQIKPPLIQRSLILTGVLLPMLFGALPSAEAADAWLKLRRKGPKAVLSASRAALATTSWRATWRAIAPAGTPLHGLTLEITHIKAERTPKKTKIKGQHRPPAPPTTQDNPMITIVRLRGEGIPKVVGVTTRAGKIWMRGPKDKTPIEAKPVPLFAPLPLLGVPLALFVVPALSAQYDARIEGEFNGSAILLLSPRYTTGQGMQKLKLGISKRNLIPTVSEVAGKNGDALHRLLWLKTRIEGDLVIAERLRLRTLKRSTPIDFKLLKVEQGKKLGKMPLGPSALR